MGPASRVRRVEETVLESYAFLSILTGRCVLEAPMANVSAGVQ
jgi:hypothetical protein